MTRIVVHIDRLVLNGIDPTDAPALSTALQTELVRRLGLPTDTHALIAQGDRHRVALGRVTAGATPTATGQTIAARLLGGKP